jgi:hypothetical protein
MKRVLLTLKNYRCFSDQNPARFEIGGGFTAIVGPNNSGKSATKALFYELRNLFAYLGQPNINNLANIFEADRRESFDYLGVSDVTEIFHNQNDRPISIEIEVLDAKAYPNQGGNDCLNRIVLECDRATPKTWSFKATYRSGDRNANLFKRNQSRPSAASGQIIPLKEVNLDCKDFMEACNSLGRASYYGPFRNALNKGSGTHFDLTVGTSFAELWNDWKTAGNKARMREIDQLVESIRSLFGFAKLEISSSSNLETLMVAVDGHTYRLDELGSGIAQFIIVFGNAAINRPKLILIDEPETNLHPALQKNFLAHLASYAEDGILFSTHSIGLAVC